MGFGIIDSLSQADSSYSVTVLGRRAKPQIKVSAFLRSLTVFWKATLSETALEESWKQARLCLAFAKCEPVVIRGIRKTVANTVKTFQAVQRFVLDSTGHPLGASIAMKVKAGNEIKPIRLYLVADFRGSSTNEIGFELSRRSWEQPQIQRFILSMFRRTFADGKITQAEMDDLTAKIDELARPPKYRKAGSAKLAQTPPPQAGAKARPTKNR